MTRLFGRVAAVALAIAAASCFSSTRSGNELPGMGGIDARDGNDAGMGKRDDATMGGASGSVGAGGAGPAITGRGSFWDLAGLAQVKAMIKSGDKTFSPAADKAVRGGDKWLSQGPWSVMDKTKTAPSGDKHDYMSLASYWWPDPNSPTGLPYVRKDGMTNPDRDSPAYDYVRLNDLGDAVSALSLAYYLSDQDKYASHAATLLHTWFLDDATKMNPNLNFAQSVPGLMDGRAEGVLDTMQMARMLDGVTLLRGSPAWTAADQSALESWFSALLAWLQSSPLAKKEQSATNNHGTWYDVQTTRYALFVDKPELARTITENAKSQRIARQIEPDGRQPLELARTKSFDYSLFNLRALIDLATLARGVGVDLFGYTTTDGRSIRKALDYLFPYANPATPWPGTQIAPPKHDDFIAILRRCGIAYNEPKYEAALQMFYATALPTHLIQLVFPKP